jgi:monoterpene epsilon-lactone hydrolase
MVRDLVRSAATSVICAITSAHLYAQDKAAAPTFEPDGTVHVPAFDLPPSTLISQEALQSQMMRARMPRGAPSSAGDIGVVRKGLEAMLAPQVSGMLKQYPVDIVDQSIDGVPTRIVTPKDKPFDHKHVLINLHGGAFTMCADACAMLESVPIASIGGYKVVSVNYRMAPEAAHPAGVEDVATVYRELLKSYKPKNIGIYGCSAGGALTAEAAAWLPAHGLPQAGAVGIFGSGGVRFGAGDSAWVAAYIDGSFPPPATSGDAKSDMTRGYFANTDMSDPIVSPALHPDVIAKFPPTLIITGTRAMDMSPAIYTNSQLLKAGVHSTLIVGEGMGHCFIYQSQLPEARDAYQVIVRFFRENLK